MIALVRTSTSTYSTSKSTSFHETSSTVATTLRHYIVTVLVRFGDECRNDVQTPALHSISIVPGRGRLSKTHVGCFGDDAGIGDSLASGELVIT